VVAQAVRRLARAISRAASICAGASLLLGAILATAAKVPQPAARTMFHTEPSTV
jgi:hypothetical protein